MNTFISPAVHLRFLATYLTASLIDRVSHESLNFVTSDDAKRLFTFVPINYIISINIIIFIIVIIFIIMILLLLYL